MSENLPVPAPLPFVSTNFGSAAVSTQGVDTIFICSGSKATAYGLEQAKDISRALNACLARLSRMQKP